MAATIDDLNKRISNLETILGDIRDNTGGFKTTVGKDLQNGIKRIVDKIANTKETIITKIENGFSNNGGFSSRNGGNVTGFNSGALKNINDHYGRGQITNELKDKYDINHEMDKDIIIEEDVWIASHVTLLSGAVLGRGCEIGAGSVIRGSIPPYAVVIGNPCKVVGFRFTPEEIIEHEKVQYQESERIPIDVLKKNYEKYFINRIKDIKQFTKL